MVQFNSYQEQSYLWDPYLEALVTPVVEKLKTHAKEFVQNPRSVAGARLERLVSLLYLFVKFRGYKTISSLSAPEYVTTTELLCS